MSIDIDPDVGALVYLHHFSSDFDGLFIVNHAINTDPTEFGITEKARIRSGVSAFA